MEESEIGEVGVDKVGEQAREAAERAHVRSWIRWLALSTALFAVAAAIASLQSGRLANESLIKMNEANLKQTQASDAWAYYQAKGIKSVARQSELEILSAIRASAELIRKSQEDAERYKTEQEEIQKEARKLEAEGRQLETESRELLHHHHTFAYVVTLLQVAIGVSAVAAIVERRAIWIFALSAGMVGMILFGIGLIQMR